MRENRNFVVPVSILTPFAHAPFSWAARHTTVCLDYSILLCFEGYRAVQFHGIIILQYCNEAIISVIT